MIKIENNYQQIELDIKRFYPPCDIIVICPECGYEYEDDDCISYPDVNEVFLYDCHCVECGHCWGENIKIVVGMVVGVGE